MPGNDVFTKLLLHCDGANGSTTFTDASLAAHGNATVAGNIQVSTAQKKFGTGSAAFDGAGDSLQYADSADWTMTGDYTVDFWFRLNAMPVQGAGDFFCFISQLDTVGSANFFQFLIDYNGAVYVNIKITSGGVTQFPVVIGLFSAIDTWAHCAFVHSGGTYTAYLNGIAGSAPQVFPAMNNIAGPLDIGVWAPTFTPLYFLNGYMDEIRMSNTARWTANFTPPASPYDNYTGFYQGWSEPVRFRRLATAHRQVLATPHKLIPKPDVTATMSAISDPGINTAFVTALVLNELPPVPPDLTSVNVSIGESEDGGASASVRGDE
jgi:hypothetical protein